MLASKELENIRTTFYKSFYFHLPVNSGNVFGVAIFSGSTPEPNRSNQIMFLVQRAAARRPFVFAEVN